MQGLFPASFVEPIAWQQQGPGNLPPTDSMGGAPGKPDRESVRQMLWELGVDAETLAEVSASISVAQRKRGAGEATPDVRVPFNSSEHG